LKITFFGCFRDSIGLELKLDGPSPRSVAQLRQRLAADHPEAAATLASKRSRVCVNDAIVGDDHEIGPADAVEFLPPVSGG
jgi:molybdopterin converting factor small subunit